MNEWHHTIYGILWLASFTQPDVFKAQHTVIACQHLPPSLIPCVSTGHFVYLLIHPWRLFLGTFHLSAVWLRLLWIRLCASIWTPVFRSLGYTPRSGITGSYFNQDVSGTGLRSIWKEEGGVESGSQVRSLPHWAGRTWWWPRWRVNDKRSQHA